LWKILKEQSRGWSAFQNAKKQLQTLQRKWPKLCKVLTLPLQWLSGNFLLIAFV
jgi:hypothetical protein